MTTQEIEQAVLMIICQEYNKKYTGKIFIKRLQPQGLLIKLGLNQEEKPVMIASELSDEESLEFFRKEIRDRNLDMVKYFFGTQTLPYYEKCRTNGQSELDYY